jgi:hypothetical protein
LKRPGTFHPFLFAAFPILSLFSANFGAVLPRETLIPLALAEALTGALWLLLLPILRDSRRRGIAITIFLLLFFAYGPIIDNGRVLLGHRLSIAGLPLGIGVVAACMVAVSGLYALRRSTRTFATLNTFLNAASLIAVAIPLAGMAAKTFSMEHARDAEMQSTPPTPLQPAAADLPNVYYIILDAYTRADVLRDTFHFDNSDFLAYLTRKGFYVAGKSYANYPWTLLSLSSTFNLDYLTSLAGQSASSAGLDSGAAQQLRSSKVAALFRERGYRFVVFSAGYSLTEGLDADVVETPTALFTEFQNVLINLTPIRTVLARMPNPSQYAAHRNRILFTLDQLPRLKRDAAPLFVFAHVFAPHPPFVFDQSGNAVNPPRPFYIGDGFLFFEAGGTPEEYVTGYAEQVAYLNQRLKDVIARILAEAPHSIIVLQGDHGSRLHQTREIATTDLHEGMAILNAYHFPSPQPALYDQISPVNTFRMICNQVLGTTFPLLEDRSFSGEDTTDFHFVDITDRLN